ncbi:MAG: AAA family ATPase [Polynucleobacter sp.]
MYTLIVFDEGGTEHHIGSVKIGQSGLRPAQTTDIGQRSPNILENFSGLNEDYFSLGQDEDYYASLNKLPQPLKDKILLGLRDCAFNLDIFEQYLNEEVMSESLLRSINPQTVRSKFHRLTKGDARLTKFKFNYTLPSSELQPGTTMTFKVRPESTPPTNVHVLIGRNGVGKSRCMQQLIQCLLGRSQIDGSSPGNISLIQQDQIKWEFSGVLLISFSAFDDFELSPSPKDLLNSNQIGLKIYDGLNQKVTVKSPTELAADFSNSLMKCRQELKAERWKAAIQTLESDDLFAEANIPSLLEIPPGDDWKIYCEDLFKRLSSGHAIVLLTITRLVELVDENTLVLLDEPEGHLHPPLLSAFIRCLSDLLIKRNGVAIIATHSPVVLQEVPSSCVWKIKRSGKLSIAERPSIETFGENIGTITREIFGLEVTRSGFHELLSEAVEMETTFDEVCDSFGGQLGGEAKSIIRAMIAERKGK